MWKLWCMVVGVVPLWAVVYSLGLSIGVAAVVYVLYFTGFVVMVHRTKKGKKI